MFEVAANPDADSTLPFLILATLASLANPPPGTLSKGVEAGAAACMAAEAISAQSIATTGSGNLQQALQSLLEAPGTSSTLGVAGTASGNIDVGLYDAAFTKIISSGWSEQALCKKPGTPAGA